jgi:dTDP-glucose pyrophosphorylase
VEAVVMAAGLATRLRPLTKRWAKAVLPIDGRPVVATLVRALAEAGVGPVTVVVGYRGEQVRRLLGEGRSVGAEIRYADQPTADGSADAVRRALAAGARAPCLVAAADTVLSPGEPARFAAAFAAAETAGAIGVRTAPAPGKPGIVVDGGRVRRVYDVTPGNPLTSAPLWGLGEALVPLLDDLPGPPYELKDAYQRGIDGGLAVAAVPVGATRDLTFPLDLVEENFPYLKGLC